jgi:hypothetical protein
MLSFETCTSSTFNCSVVMSSVGSLHLVFLGPHSFQFWSSPSVWVWKSGHSCRIWMEFAGIRTVNWLQHIHVHIHSLESTWGALSDGGTCTISFSILTIFKGIMNFLIFFSPKLSVLIEMLMCPLSRGVSYSPVLIFSLFWVTHPENITETFTVGKFPWMPLAHSCHV